MTSDQPLRDALRATLEGLKTQVPVWMPPGPMEGYDEDGEEFHAGGGRRGALTGITHMHWMIDQCMAHIQDWPVDKISRWIGYVQGVLAVKAQHFNVDDERERTRPLFHAAYEAMGLEKPKTQDR